MKKIIFALSLIFVTSLFIGCAGPRSGTRVAVSTTYRSPGPAPFSGAIWIGPEYAYRGGRYVEVPGYWSRPIRPRAVWIPGHWQYRGRHHRTWVSGHWRY